MFVAATMPEEPEGGRGVSVDLRKRFPGLQWLAGRQLHQAQQQLQHTWLPVSDSTWQSSLVVRTARLEVTLAVAQCWQDDLLVDLRRIFLPLQRLQHFTEEKSTTTVHLPPPETFASPVLKLEHHLFLAIL